jgi:hypothetical protein
MENKWPPIHLAQITISFAGRAADPHNIHCGRPPFRRIAARRWASQMPVSGWVGAHTHTGNNWQSGRNVLPAAAVDTKHKFAIYHDLPFRLLVMRRWLSALISACRLKWIHQNVTSALAKKQLSACMWNCTYADCSPYFCNSEWHRKYYLLLNPIFLYFSSWF